MSGGTKKSVKKQRRLSNLHFCQRSHGALRQRDAKQRRRCSGDGVNCYRAVSERTWERGQREHYGCLQSGRRTVFPPQVEQIQNSTSYGRTNWFLEAKRVFFSPLYLSGLLQSLERARQLDRRAAGAVA